MPEAREARSVWRFVEEGLLPQLSSKDAAEGALVAAIAMFESAAKEKVESDTKAFAYSSITVAKLD